MEGNCILLSLVKLSSQPKTKQAANLNPSLKARF